MGDCSAEAYDHLMSLFKKCSSEMKPFIEVRDGLGLEDRQADNVDVLNQVQSKGALIAVEAGANSAMNNEDKNSARESGNMLAGLLPLGKPKEIGRPMTSREKAPYEGFSKRTRFCSISQKQGQMNNLTLSRRCSKAAPKVIKILLD